MVQGRRDAALMALAGGLWTGICWLLAQLAYPHLPPKVPVHFNLYWQPDGWASKGVLLWLMPLTVAIVWAVIGAVTSLATVQERRLLWQVQWWIGMFMVAVQGSLLLTALGWLHSPRPILMPALGLLLVAIGRLCPQLPQNRFVGVRVPWTLKDEVVWRQVHQVAGLWLTALGVGFVTVAVLPLPVWTDAVLMLSLLAIFVALCSYAVRLYRRRSAQTP
ncbi:Immunity protein SdpI [bacterium HR17]|uniref:Immunity protein SdpI n=1 Tax=Candidatus Fervidibacter japonicus TaxID=2035412 RepID=A0A2H5XF95_9BACT|nr:Immunity protein SdpI [bacterium HR17]